MDIQKLLLAHLSFVVLLFATDRESKSYLIPAVTTMNSGVERVWMWSGVSGGLILGKHRIGGEFYYLNKDVSHAAVTLENTLHLFGTLYATWEYEFHPTSFLIMTAGVSVGYQYAEVDKNWDSTFVGLYRQDSQELTGTVPLNWEAEGKVQSFGGPQISCAIGRNRLYVHTRFRVNIGFTKKWGGYKSNDPSVREIYMADGLYVGDIKLSEPGWQKSNGGVLNQEFSILPELQLGLLFRF